MTIGMKRGTVYLEDHQPEWETAASETIRDIKSILQKDAVDVQHIGSTSIRPIPAKPIIDIAVAVRGYDARKRFSSRSRSFSALTNAPNSSFSSRAISRRTPAPTISM